MATKSFCGFISSLALLYPPISAWPAAAQAWIAGSWGAMPSCQCKRLLRPFPPGSSQQPHARAGAPVVALEVASVWMILSRTAPALGGEEAVDISQAGGSAVGESAETGAISVLLFAAFVGLFILTIGVIYLAVSDITDKREREKAEKLANSKSSKKKKGKKLMPLRADPRGFGNKNEDGDN